jgi:hypothetical protein
VALPAARLGFAKEFPHRFVGEAEVRRQDFQSYPALERDLLGLVNHGHAAAADLPDDAEVTELPRAGFRPGAGTPEKVYFLASLFLGRMIIAVSLFAHRASFR